MAEQKMTYEEASTQIEQILAKFRNNEISIDDLASEVKRATELITLCREKLTTAEEDLKKVLE